MQSRSNFADNNIFNIIIIFFSNIFEKKNLTYAVFNENGFSETSNMLIQNYSFFR